MKTKKQFCQNCLNYSGLTTMCGNCWANLSNESFANTSLFYQAQIKNLEAQVEILNAKVEFLTKENDKSLDLVIEANEVLKKFTNAITKQDAK